tara:strand:- start:35119 stop:35361 length:243 start_codon:yes stop_codon:yes gene_type:complete
MEIIAYTAIWLAVSGLFAMLLLSNDPYARAKKLADIALERIEVLKHKWLESEKAGRDIGMESAKKSWKKNHAKKWKASRR